MAKKDINQNKNNKLIVSIIFDLFGMASYAVPGIGELTDLFFAPIQGLWIYSAYGNIKWTFFGVAEEALPFTDFIPSCLISHFLYYGKAKKKI